MESVYWDRRGPAVPGRVGSTRKSCYGACVPGYRNPLPTVDILIEVGERIVVVERANPPPGWALPGGFVDYGETLEDAARREALEETGLKVTLVEQLHTYSDPSRDPRHHTITTVFIARAEGEPRGGDDARSARLVPADRLPEPMAFDHARIVADYLAFKRTGARPRP